MLLKFNCALNLVACGPSNIKFVPVPKLMGRCGPGKCSNGSWSFTDPKNFLHQFTPCEYKKITQNEYIGDIPLEAEVYCQRKTLRWIPKYSCCSPQSVTSSFPKFYYFPVGSKAFSTKPSKLQWFNKSDSSKLPPNGDIVFLIHGAGERPIELGSLWIQPVLQAWTQIRKKPVIVVDHFSGTHQFFQIAANVRTVGQALGYALLNWNITDRAILVGASIGGQVLGEAGKYAKKHGKTIKECVGIDPAGPTYDGGSEEMRITPDDCKLVQIIHSSSKSSPSPLGLLSGNLGTFYHSGSCDFWINCGRSQGFDCQNPTLAALMSDVPADRVNDSAPNFTCAHMRGPIIYAASVAQKCEFVGYECVNCSQIRKTRGCHVNFSGSRMSLPPYNECKPGDRKDFYVQALGNNYPYCSDGINICF